MALRSRTETRSASPQHKPKTAHRFRLGESVIPFSPGIPLGPYVIVRLLPLVNGEPHYQAKCKADGHVRALLEQQIRGAVGKSAADEDPASSASA